MIVEDDYDGEYRYDHQPVGALQGLDPERVVYAGTVSKTLAPALRLGWLVLPNPLVEPALEAKTLLAGEVSAIEQLTMAELLHSGAYDRHVRRTRLRYRRRRDLLIELLATHTPPLMPRGIAAGLHVVVDLPAGTDEAELLARAAASDLALNTLTPFWHDPAGRPAALALGYAAPPDHAFAQTLAARDGALLAPDAIGPLGLHAVVGAARIGETRAQIARAANRIARVADDLAARVADADHHADELVVEVARQLLHLVHDPRDGSGIPLLRTHHQHRLLGDDALADLVMPGRARGREAEEAVEERLHPARHAVPPQRRRVDDDVGLQIPRERLPHAVVDRAHAVGAPAGAAVAQQPVDHRREMYDLGRVPRLAGAVEQRLGEEAGVAVDAGTRREGDDA